MPAVHVVAAETTAEQFLECYQMSLKAKLALRFLIAIAVFGALLFIAAGSFVDNGSFSEVVVELERCVECPRTVVGLTPFSTEC